MAECSNTGKTVKKTKEKRPDLLEQEKLRFYLKSGLWFFRFIIAKDKKHEYQELILNARVEFLNNIKGRKIDCGIRSKIEVFMLKYVYFVFKMFAYYWGGAKKGAKV